MVTETNVNPFLVFGSEVVKRFQWIKQTPIFYLVFPMFLFVSTLGIWAVSLFKGGPLWTSFTNQTLVIYCAPLVFNMVIDAILKKKTEGHPPLEGRISLIILIIFLSFIWCSIWAYDIFKNGWEFSIVGFFCSLTMILFYMFFISGDEIYSDSNINTGAPSNRSKKPEKGALE